jgi:hypothetical protein
MRLAVNGLYQVYYTVDESLLIPYIDARISNENVVSPSFEVHLHYLLASAHFDTKFVNNHICMDGLHRFR